MDPRLIFQRILADRLTRVLSEWGKLDERQINLSMLTKGDITLEGLTLQTKDLPGFGLRVKGGFIKHLSIKVPWKQLKKASVRVDVKEMFVILGPRAMTGATPHPAAQTMHGAWLNRALHLQLRRCRPQAQLGGGTGAEAEKIGGGRSHRG
jgi:hypothetical protein